ncbi:MAG: hypothetical protein HYU39_05815 [Thaumarchaeota archaeon]|nr:hypothetical protein [Nitrososphaerota archaeon]
MSVYQVSKLIHRLYADEVLRKRFREDPALIIDTVDVTEEEKKVLLEKDYVALYGMGVHPMLVAHIVSVNGDYEKFLKEDVPRLKNLRNPYQDYYLEEEETS